MKKTLISTVIICSMVGLVGCSTNTQSQNTGIGVVSGAVVGGLAGSLIGGGAGKVVAIGVGAVAGALVGCSIGHSMDHSDNTTMSNAMYSNSTNQGTTWTNNRTGATYTVVPTSKMMTYKKHHNCRTYYTTAVISGKTQKVYGVACRKADGSWYVVK